MLIETGYLSNRDDAALLLSADGEQRIGKAIARAIEAHFAAADAAVTPATRRRGEAGMTRAGHSHIRRSIEETMMTETATFAGGCFWCTEAVFDALSGRRTCRIRLYRRPRRRADLREVCSGATGHAEAVRITFDPAQVTYADLLDIFFHTHDPTTLNRQGADAGTQYRSAIFPHSPEQKAAAEAAIARNQADWDNPIVTRIEADAPWYKAEAYHQRYFEKNPHAGYCAAVVRPKVAKFRKGYAARLKAA